MEGALSITVVKLKSPHCRVAAFKKMVSPSTQVAVEFMEGPKTDEDMGENLPGVMLVVRQGST